MRQTSEIIIIIIDACMAAAQDFFLHMLAHKLYYVYVFKYTFPVTFSPVLCMITAVYGVPFVSKLC